jgi:TolB-like protein/Tfp pilus assembly protein PilF
VASIGRFLGELKQRNVIRVAGVYAVTTWGVFQIVNTLFPVFNMPKWTVTLVAVLLLIGFPIALVIAWAFEKGPDGIRRTVAADGAKPRFVLTDWLLLAALVAIVAVTVAQMTGVFGRTRVAEGAAGPSAASAAAGKSVAVLPFASFSQGQEAEYFADGLTEEVINSLANIPELKVAGRTSSFYFKGRNENLREIGAKLGVAYVMEGSVRRDGERIRITGQLIKVSDGFHVWSQVYDRDFKDALAIQTEIANTVAGVLKAKILSPDAAAARNPETYKLILQARGRMRDLGAENLHAARRLYQRAIKLDPGSAEAHAGLAHADILLAQNYMALNYADARKESEAAIATALRLDPNSVDAYIASGFLNSTLNLRAGGTQYAERAAAAYKRAFELAPRNPDVLVYYGDFLSGGERNVEGIGLLQRALEVDPLNRLALTSLAAAQAYEGRTDEAVQSYRTVINLYPDFVDGPEHLGLLLSAQGRLDEAEAWLRRAARSTADPTASMELAHVYYCLGMDEDASAALAGMKGSPVAVNLQAAIRRVVARDYTGLIRFSEAQYAATQDPFWPSVIGVGALYAGDDRKVLEQVRIVRPDLLGPDPQMGSDFDVPLNVAHALNGVGLRDQARRVLDRVLAATAPAPGRKASPVRRMRRAQAYAELGDRAKALAELRQAVKEGYRWTYDQQDFVRIEDQANFTTLRDDPEFRAIVAQIHADNGRMRAKVLAARGGGRP